MPVVTVIARPLGSADSERSAAGETAAAVAAALGLGPADVWVGVVPCAVGAFGTGEPAQWPIVTLRGRSRPAMDAAAQAAAQVVARHWDCPVDAVWTEWLVR